MNALISGSEKIGARQTGVLPRLGAQQQARSSCGFGHRIYPLQFLWPWPACSREKRLLACDLNDQKYLWRANYQQGKLSSCGYEITEAEGLRQAECQTLENLPWLKEWKWHAQDNSEPI